MDRAGSSDFDGRLAAITIGIPDPQLYRRATHHLLPRIAGHAQEPLVDVHIYTIFITIQRKRVRAGLEYHPGFLFALLQAAIGPGIYDGGGNLAGNAFQEIDITLAVGPFPGFVVHQENAEGVIFIANGYGDAGLGLQQGFEIVTFRRQFCGERFKIVDQDRFAFLEQGYGKALIL